MLRLALLLVLPLAFAAPRLDPWDGLRDQFEVTFLELEAHEDTPTPPFSVCKFLLESSAQRIKQGDSWSEMAGHIADVRDTLPEHVRTACDDFVKHNVNEIVSLLQVSSPIEDIAAEAAQEEAKAMGSTAPETPQTEGNAQQDVFKKFWEEKGKYCGACLTMTKKIQKWLNLNCTQGVISDRVLRMCTNMPSDLRDQCTSNHIWIKEYVIKELFNKFPLPNHCAYLGLCEKTMVIRSLQNPLVMSDNQNELIQNLEGRQPNLVQEDQVVLQRPHETVTTTPEVTFNLDDGGVSYRDVDPASGDGLPKLFMDGSHQASDLREDAFAMLEVEGDNFDLSNPNDPKVTIHAQDSESINVPIMHADLKQNGHAQVSKDYKFQQNKLPIDGQWLKGCAACQFTIGALFEFLSNPRTIRTVLPAVKKSCRSCNSPEEIVKCEEFVENHGVAFYQDVVRQGSASKWCPKLQLCEMQYFVPSPHVLSESYNKVKDAVTAVGDF